MVLNETVERIGNPTNVLHVAPEKQIRALLAPLAQNYVATDLTRGLSSYAGRLSAASDLTCLPFHSDGFDLVLASHVLEHIPDDRAAAREVYRVLRPGGVALLPVPITHDGPTVEYDEPNPVEEMHVRAPGLDYFDRFEELGFDVVVKASFDYPAKHQLLSYHRQTRGSPANPPTVGGAQALTGFDQYIPVCSKAG